MDKLSDGKKLVNILGTQNLPVLLMSLPRSARRMTAGHQIQQRNCWRFPLQKRRRRILPNWKPALMPQNQKIQATWKHWASWKRNGESDTSYLSNPFLPLARELMLAWHFTPTPLCGTYTWFLWVFQICSESCPRVSPLQILHNIFEQCLNPNSTVNVSEELWSHRNHLQWQLVEHQQASSLTSYEPLFVGTIQERKWL